MYNKNIKYIGNDIPIKFNIELLPNSSNDLAVMRSKAIGVY
jgi:hypothetical protein